MITDLPLDDQAVVERMAAAARIDSAVELQMAQIARAAMEEFHRQALPPVRLALAAAHAAGLVMIGHDLEEAAKWRLQTDLAVLLMKRFRAIDRLGVG